MGGAPAAAFRAVGQRIGTLAGAALPAAVAAEPDRWILWLPVALGAGIGIYFSLAAEPAIWVAPLGVAGAVGLAVVGRRSEAALVAAALLGAVFLGAAIAQWRTHAAAGPVLERRWGPAELTGRVVAIEIRPEGRRIILDRANLPGVQPDATPVQIRVRLAETATVLRPGDRIAIRAQLFPPPAPAAPGAYDFQFQAWFSRLGAVGTARGAPRVLAPAEEGSFWLALNAARVATVERVMAAIPGPAGTIAAALITGEQGQIPLDLLGWMRDSGLAHILSISGLHITLVAGFVFLIVRRGCALIPPLALRYPIKKIAAVFAFFAITFYMLFASPGVPTQRSWMMTGIVLFAIVIDRTAITMRLVAWAAFVVLLLFPESMLGPSFQMSFGAVVALIATWETMRDRLSAARAGRGLLGRSAVALAGMTLTSLVASLATAPFALYHFNRFTAYGLAANLLAVPLTGMWIMPWVVVAFVLLPFGVEAWALVPMAWGIDAMIWVGRTVAGWSGAVALVPAMPAWGLAALSLGGLWLCIWQGRVRWLGAAPVAAGLASLLFWRGPDVLIAGDARLVAVRGADGGLAFSTGGRGNNLVRETWLRRDGLESAVVWPGQGVSADGRLACDPTGCVYTARGHVVAIARRPEALADDCRYATVLIATVSVRRPCPAPQVVIDRAALVRDGGHAVWLGAEGDAQALSVRSSRGDRPWVPQALRPLRPITRQPTTPRIPAVPQLPVAEDADDDTPPD